MAGCVCYVRLTLHDKMKVPRERAQNKINHHINAGMYLDVSVQTDNMRVDG